MKIYITDFFFQICGSFWSALFLMVQIINKNIIVQTIDSLTCFTYHIETFLLSYIFFCFSINIYVTICSRDRINVPFEPELPQPFDSDSSANTIQRISQGAHQTVL